MASRRVRRRLTTWACTLALLATATLGRAATFTVDTVLDDPARTACDDATPDDCSLRGAILAANGLAEPTTIDVPAGVYALSQSSSCTFRVRDFRIPTVV